MCSFFLQERRNSLKNFVQKLNFRLRASDARSESGESKKSKKPTENGHVVK